MTKRRVTDTWDSDESNKRQTRLLVSGAQNTALDKRNELVNGTYLEETETGIHDGGLVYTKRDDEKIISLRLADL